MRHLPLLSRDRRRTGHNSCSFRLAIRLCGQHVSPFETAAPRPASIKSRELCVVLSALTGQSLQVPRMCLRQHRPRLEWRREVGCGVVSCTLQCRQRDLQVCEQWRRQQPVLVSVHCQQHKVQFTSLKAWRHLKLDKSFELSA